MHTKAAILAYLRAHPRAVFGLVFLVFLLVHIVIFRDIVAAIPSILQGKTILVREELIPFFSFGSQFWPTDTSQLTMSNEMRVLYSFWTSWVRHYAVLPFAIVLLNTFSATILFYAFYRIGRFFAASRTSSLVVVAAALAAFLIHFILLYAKVTHFYTLVFGFSLFALALSLALEQIFFRERLRLGNMWAVALLVLFNPAVHYHVIFYVIFAFFVLVHAAFTWALNRRHVWFYLKRNLLYAGIVGAVSLLPYVAFLLFVGGDSASSAADNVPINYWLIYYWSLPLTSLLSLDTAAQIDLFRYGSYIIPSPRVFSTVVMFVIGSIFLLKQWASLHIIKRVLVISLFAALLVSMWMALGYSASSSFSFHHLISGITLYLNDQANGVSQLFAQAIATFVNILRFPHRFQFIFFFVAGVLFTIGLIWIGEKVRQKRSAALSITAVVVLALMPILGAKDYFSVLSSGNFANYLQPYQVSPDLAHIQGELAKSDQDRLFILPTMESGRDMRANGNDYSFIDKFFLFYLNQPTLYYGTDVKPEHKGISYAAYRAIADNQPWWDELLVQSLGVTHILQPKQLHERSVGSEYMPGVIEKINEKLEQSNLFTKTYDGPDFALYQTAYQPTAANTLVDMQWSELAARLTASTPQDRLYFPLQLSTFGDVEGQTLLLSDSLERSFYNLYTSRHPDRVFYPSTVPLAFSKELVASSTFTANTLSMDVLNDKNNTYNYIHERMPSMLNTHSSRFTGVAAGDTALDMRVSVPADGTYRLLVHAASRSAELVGAIGNRGVVFKKIADDQGKHTTYVDMTYFIADVQLPAGKHNLTLHNPGQNGLIAESATLLSQADTPPSFKSTVSQAGVTITQTNQKHSYTITLEEAP